MSKIKIFLLVVLVALVGIQFVPVERTNPPVLDEIDAPPEVLSVLRDACYDCHSNETTWPWYTRAAPISWWILDHVEDGRKHLNFSSWLQLGMDDRSEFIEEIWKEVHEGEMPPWHYQVLHPAARLSLEGRTVLRLWAEAEKQASDGS